MGINAGAIYVDLPTDRTAAEVVEAIAAWWQGKGAQVEVAPAEGVPATTLRATGGERLGFLVARRGAGIVTVLDSEGYTADPRLARALSRALRAPTCAVELAEAVDDAALKAYGKWPVKPAGKGFAALAEVARGLDPERYGLLFEDVDQDDGWLPLWLSGVDPAQYSSVPFPSRKRYGQRAPWVVPVLAAWEAGDAPALVRAIGRHCRLPEERAMLVFDRLRRLAHHALHQAAHDEAPRAHLDRAAGLFVDAAVAALGQLTPAGFAQMVAEIRAADMIGMVEVLLACRVADRPDAFADLSRLCEGLRVDLSDEQSLSYLVGYMELLGQREVAERLFERYRSHVGELQTRVAEWVADPTPSRLAAVTAVAARPELRATSLYNRAARVGAAGHHQLALLLLEEASRRENPPWQVYNNALAHAILATKTEDELRDLVEPWIARGAHLGDNPHFLHNVACVHAELSEDEQAIDLLRRALAAGADADTLHGDESFEALRGRPAFETLFSS